MGDNEKAGELLARLDEIEGRLDPGARRRGRIVADTVTVSILAPISIALDWHANQPFLMLGLMMAGLVVNRIAPFFTERSLRRERDRLFSERSGGEAQFDAGTV